MREFIQAKLNEISTIDNGSFIPDGIIEVGTTYFGYELQDNYKDEDFTGYEIRQISIIGFIVRKVKSTEDTLSIIDQAKTQVQDKLKELNFKIISQDITLQDDIRKIKITGNVIYNEINNEFI